MTHASPAARGRLHSTLSAAILAVALAAGIASAAEPIDPKADQILKSMAAYLGAAKALSFNADIDVEFVMSDHQKLQISSFATAMLERPSKIHVHRKGMIADSDVYFDGTTLSLYGRNLGVYAQRSVPGTIDDAIRAYEWETGLPAPGADLLLADPYKGLMDGVTKATYVGTTQIAGVECHHLAFRKDKVDWQIWVQTGDRPLPMKYVITSKWQAAAPQYELRLRDWNTAPNVGPGSFAFVPPAGATRVDALNLEETEDLSAGQGARK